MNKKFYIIILLFSFNSIFSEPERMPCVIRTIDGGKIVSGTLEGKDIESRLTEIRNELDKEIKSLDERIQKKATDFQNKARTRTVDPDILEKLQAEILRERKERDVKAESAQEQFSREFKRELGKFNNEIKKSVSDVAEKEGWDIVKIKETGEIVYCSPRIDVSDKIINAHDASYKAKKTKKAAEKSKVD